MNREEYFRQKAQLIEEMIRDYQKEEDINKGCTVICNCGFRNRLLRYKKSQLNNKNTKIYEHIVDTTIL